MDAVAVRELEPQPVELPARHRDAEARAVLRVLEREEDARPALRAPQLRDLALDPDRGQAGEPGGDPAVERADGVDLAVAVRGRLDLHEARIRLLPAAEGDRDRLRPAANPELAEDALNVGRHGLRANHQLAGDLVLLTAFRKELQDLSFTL